MLGEQRGVRPIVCEASRCEHRVMRGDETLLICGRVHVRYAGHTAGVRFRHQPLGAAAQHELELPFRLELLDLQTWGWRSIRGAPPGFMCVVGV
eukprot:scaffold5336_cov97-Isochrysis_galbana.AAC.2